MQSKFSKASQDTDIPTEIIKMNAGIFADYVHSDINSTVWKVSVFRVFLVRIFPHLDWIRTDTPLISLCILPECGEIRTGKTPNTDTFHAAYFF